MKCAVIAGGGELLLRARAAGVPHIQIPWEEATPARRMLPVALRALSLMVMGKDEQYLRRVCRRRTCRCV